MITHSCVGSWVECSLVGKKLKEDQSTFRWGKGSLSIVRMMLEPANVLIMDDPTNHLDLESITALNDALVSYPGSILFTSHDHEFIQTIANHIIEVGPKGNCSRQDTSYDEFLDKESFNRSS